jgi:hypothetical protein
MCKSSEESKKHLEVDQYKWSMTSKDWRKKRMGEVDRSQNCEESLICYGANRNSWLPREKKNASARKDQAFVICRKISFLILRVTIHSQNIELLNFFQKKNYHKANHFFIPEPIDQWV